MLNCRFVFAATSHISLSSPVFAMFPSSSCMHYVKLIITIQQCKTASTVSRHQKGVQTQCRVRAYQYGASHWQEE